MTRTLMIALALALTSAPPALALTQLELSAQRDLREYGFKNVDVQSLTTAQLAAISTIANTPGREGGKRGLIASALGKPYNLRGLLFQDR